MMSNSITYSCDNSCEAFFAILFPNSSFVFKFDNVHMPIYNYYVTKVTYHRLRIALA